MYFEYLWKNESFMLRVTQTSEYKHKTTCSSVQINWDKMKKTWIFDICLLKTFKYNSLT
jgi:hypothetical protein